MRLCLCCVLAMILAVPSRGANDDLFAQSAQAALQREFASHRISYVAVEAGSGKILASRWDDDSLLPVGSLVKPFVALAFASTHSGPFPRHHCAGRDQCWLPAGHGDINLHAAISHSCNAYFRALVERSGPLAVAQVARAYSLTPPPEHATPNDLIGLTNVWRVSPVSLVRAYLQLATEHEPTRDTIIAGLRDAARFGTGAAVRQSLHETNVLIKTGTAPCSHVQHKSGDGFALVLAPADAPRLALLVRVHGTTGARSAAVAGQMVAALLERPRGVTH